MTHHHDHVHDHGHSHDTPESGSGLGFSEKLEKMLDHWLRHNADHAQTYRKWEEMAKNEGMEGVASLIKEAADASDSMNELFRKALDLLKTP